MMQFIRYAKCVKELGATVLINIHAPLMKLFTLCDFIDQLSPRGSKHPTIDIKIPIMSLPFIFNTTLETVPADIPYLYADEHLIKFWKEKITQDKNFKIGLAWVSKSKHLEKNYLTRRSVPLKNFAPLAELHNVSFYSLQKTDGLDQLSNLPQNFTVKSFGPDFDNTNGRFMDTAALIMNLDLVITSDTSIAHLAGALGKETWILLPYVAEWRWMQERNTTPWYPNARLFRQKKHSDWTHVIQAIKEELQKIILNN